MTFARIAKVLAVLLVALALWRMREPTPPARVVVLALPGAAADVIPTVVGELYSGEIRSSEPWTGGAWWRRLLSWGDAADSPMLWDGEGPAARPVAVPARLLPPRQQAEAIENGFVGSNSGVVVEAVDITSGRLPAPYDRAIDAVAAAAANLPHDQWSEWIPVTPGANDGPPGAEFQFAHYTDSTYFFTPAYVVAEQAFVGLPFLRGLDRSLRPIVSTHVIDLARRRLTPVRELFRDGGDTTAVIAFSSAVEAPVSVFAPDSTPAAVLERAGNAVVADLAILREVVGQDGLVLVIGGPPTTRQPVGTPWYRLVQGGRGATAAEIGAAHPLEFDGARTLVRYLLGIVLEESRKGLLPADLAGRFPVRPVRATDARQTGDGPPAMPWSVDAIDSVPDALD